MSSPVPLPACAWGVLSPEPSSVRGAWMNPACHRGQVSSPHAPNDTGQDLCLEKAIPTRTTVIISRGNGENMQNANTILFMIRVHVISLV